MAVFWACTRFSGGSNGNHPISVLRHRGVAVLVAWVWPEHERLE
jgi:hypothetical protein